MTKLSSMRSSLQAYKDQLQMEMIMTSNMFALMKNGHFLEEKKEGKVSDIGGPWEGSGGHFHVLNATLKKSNIL